MPREPKLDMLPDKDMKLSGEHFRKVVRRIESIVPLAGDGIKVEEVDGGHKIINDQPAPFGPCGFIAQGYALVFDTVELNVCSNGTPDTISVVILANGRNSFAEVCEGAL
jgi:hypothetical protein